MKGSNTEDFDDILHKIITIRGQKVMLDFNLAMLYQVDTKMLKRAVRRNLKRFPPDFMFELNKEEWENLRYHSGTSSWGGSRYTPFAFTEHGITMLASILNSDRAIKMNIAIVRAFISLRQITLEQKELFVMLEQFRQELCLRINEHDTQLSAIYEVIESLLDGRTEMKSWESREMIGFKK